MPIYEYECTSCCRVLEVIQRITEAPLTTCPDCSGAVRKLMSKSSFQLKGGGWYVDGYSSSSANGSAGSDAAGDTTASSADKAASSSTKEPTSSAPTKETSPATT